MDLAAVLFPVFTLLGGLAFFLYGMNAMSDGLEGLQVVNWKKHLKNDI